MPAEKVSIAEIRSRIDAWRIARPGSGRHMPKVLWAAAAQLAKLHGVGAVAKQLALNSYRLKRYTNCKSANALRRSTPNPSTGGASVQVIEVAPIHITGADHLKSAAHPTAVLTVPNGVSLTLYQHLDSNGVAALIRAATAGVVCSR